MFRRLIAPRHLALTTQEVQHAAGLTRIDRDAAPAQEENQRRAFTLRGSLAFVSPRLCRVQPFRL